MRPGSGIIRSGVDTGTGGCQMVIKGRTAHKQRVFIEQTGCATRTGWTRAYVDITVIQCRRACSLDSYLIPASASRVTP
jgi:hypothetical protein